MSVTSVRPIQDIIFPIRDVEGADGDSVLKRVWDAVVDFFTHLAEKIKEGAEVVWNHLKNCFCPEAEKSDVEIELDRIEGLAEPVSIESQPMSESLRAKLAPYRNMPLGDAPFLEKSIGNIRTVLQRADERLSRELQAKLGVDAVGLAAQMSVGQEQFTRQMAERNPPIRAEDLPYQLATFNEGLEYIDPSICIGVMEAALRAFVFSSDSMHNHIPRYFSHMERGQDNRQRYVSYGPQLNALKAIFRSLPIDQKEMVLDSFCCTPNKLEHLQENGKRILKEIVAYKNLLTQNNAPFLQDLQTVHRKLYPPAAAAPRRAH